MESIEEFQKRARAWAVESLPADGDETLTDRELQAVLFDGGFAGIAMPKEYGGCGLTLQHQQVFYDEAVRGLRVPVGYMVSIGMLGATLMDHGSEVLKARHLPRILRGDEEWIQLLSEPSGGSDMAGALTRLTRDGETYVLNGAKMWSSGARQADYGMCLARSDWDAPKHRGLSMIAVPLQGTPGVVIEAIREVTGAEAHFCQEFFDDVQLPIENLVGEENQGWPVAQTLLYHERLATAGAGHGYGLSGAAARTRWVTGDRVADARRHSSAAGSGRTGPASTGRGIAHRADGRVLRERADHDRHAHRAFPGAVGIVC